MWYGNDEQQDPDEQQTRPAHENPCLLYEIHIKKLILFESPSSAIAVDALGIMSFIQLAPNFPESLVYLKEIIGGRRISIQIIKLVEGGM